MTQLYLVRHGETDWNIEGRWHGQADIPLNARGREQAGQILAELAACGVKAIFSSDLGRARQTAEILARGLGMPITLDARLREINQGEWQGLRLAEIQEHYPIEFQQQHADPFTYPPPGGETATQVQARVLGAVAEIISLHPEDSAAVVSHGVVIALISAYYMQLPITAVWNLIPPNASVVRLMITAKKAES